jgi:bifunctional DNA-binding transcriptional regulator/antitoxin component of YhaV-PrlF toxin-antitoxin module
MATLTVGPGGELTLPADILARHGWKPDRTVRVSETTSGLLLVPLEDGPMNQELAEELTGWQQIAAEVWSDFPYEGIDV